MMLIINGDRGISEEINDLLGYNGRKLITYFYHRKSRKLIWINVIIRVKKCGSLPIYKRTFQTSGTGLYCSEIDYTGKSPVC